MLNMVGIKELIKIGELQKLKCKVDKLGASSNRKTFFLRNSKGDFKLRRCYDKEDANQLDERIRKTLHLNLFPEYFGQEGEWVCFKYLNFPEAKREESLNFWREVGKSIANLESIKSDELDISFGRKYETIKNFNFYEYIEKAIIDLTQKKFLDRSNNFNLINSLEKLLADKEMKICFGNLDLLAGNTLLNSDKIYFIDEEAIARSVNGISFIRPLDIWKKQSPEIGISQDSKKVMLESYANHNGNLDFFKRNERKLGLLYYTIKAYDSLILDGTTNCSIRRLKYLLEKNDKRL